MVVVAGVRNGTHKAGFMRSTDIGEKLITLAQLGTVKFRVLLQCVREKGTSNVAGYFPVLNFLCT